MLRLNEAAVKEYCLRHVQFKPATHLAILYADRRDRRKSPGVPGAAIAIFADRRHGRSLPRRRPLGFVTRFLPQGRKRVTNPKGRLCGRLPSAYKIADIWYVRYWRLNSPAFAKCSRSRDFLRALLRIASKANPSGWAILSYDFSKLPHRRDRRKKSPGVSASIGGENRLRFSLVIKFAAIGV